MFGDSIGWRAAFACILATALAAAVLSACGGGGESGEQTTSAAVGTEKAAGAAQAEPEPGDEKAGEAGRQDDGGGAAASRRSTGGGAASRVRLSTDPRSVKGARVTRTGAVQTLPPTPADREEAMANTYASIKAYGEEVEGADATAITFALVQYLSARAGGDAATACARLYSVLRDNLLRLASRSDDPAVREGGCPVAFGVLTKGAPATALGDAARIDVASVRRQGNRAFVIYKTPETISVDMPMYLEDGNWVVGAIEAYALTPQMVAQGQ